MEGFWVEDGCDCLQDITLSFQSTDTQTLKNIKRANISLQSFQELQNRFSRDKIPTYTDIIIGLPGESYESYANGVSSVIEGGQHNRIFFMNLSILPNAEMGDPEYQAKFGMVTVENEVVYIRGSINQSQDLFVERQELVIANNTLSKEDWVRARSYAWVCNLLHFNKLLQISLVILNRIFSCSYRELIELFSEADHSNFPILTEIKQFFASVDWLGVYWPVDEYFFIKLCTENKLEAFYEEAERRLTLFLYEKGLEPPTGLLRDAINLNRNLVKQPFVSTDIQINTTYNVWEFYLGVLSGIEVPLKIVLQSYQIDRTSKSWVSWDSWYREVVWYGSKAGAFLYSVSHIEEVHEEFVLAGHH